MVITIDRGTSVVADSTAGLPPRSPRIRPGVKRTILTVPTQFQ
jgi:hypothetical protein